MSKKFKDLTGDVFGRLTVETVVGKSKNGHYLWSCQCECGNTTKVTSSCLISGHTRSCGCFQKERAFVSNLTHGHSKNGKVSRTYKTWYSMIQRCNNPNSRGYERYGGRGIHVCDRWLLFENFLEDMGEAPKKLTIDRIKNEGNYEPENCKWSTQKEQQNNRRNNKIIEFRGETHNLTQWSEILRIDYDVLRKRLEVWSVERAFTYPVRIGKSNKPIVEKQIV